MAPARPSRCPDPKSQTKSQIGAFVDLLLRGPKASLTDFFKPPLALQELLEQRRLCVLS